MIAFERRAARCERDNCGDVIKHGALISTQHRDPGFEGQAHLKCAVSTYRYFRGTTGTEWFALYLREARKALRARAKATDPRQLRLPGLD